MSKVAILFAAFMVKMAALKSKLAAIRAKLAKAFALTSSLPNVMDREEADQTHARLVAMQKHADEASNQQNHYGYLKAVASHTELDSVNSDHWFEKDSQPYSDAKPGEQKKTITKNRLMSQSKMTNTRLNAYIDTIKKDTDNDIDRDAHT